MPRSILSRVEAEPCHAGDHNLRWYLMVTDTASEGGHDPVLFTQCQIRTSENTPSRIPGEQCLAPPFHGSPPCGALVGMP